MVASPVSTLATLFTAHAPVEEYRQRRRAAGAPSAAVSLSAIDTFLMSRVTAYAPLSPHVVDLAADATDGDSVAFWVGTGLPVIVPRVSWHPAPDPDWRPFLRVWAAGRTMPVESGETTACPTFVEATLATPDAWRAITADLPDGTPLVITLAETAETAAHTAAHLDLLRRCAPDATVLLLPLGATGTGPVLAQALGACPPGGSRRLTALRELAPFFAASEIGMVASADDAMVPAILERINGLVAGNFQFITLVQQVIESAQALDSPDAKRAEMQASDARRAETQASDARRAETQASDARRAETQASDARRAETQASDARRAETQTIIDDLHSALAEKDAYAQWLEDRLRYLEETLLPWKNTVLAEFEREVRTLDASKALRAERIVRRLMRR